MSLLSGIGNWIRKEADNVGSFVTGQPAHGQQPAQPNQPNQPQQIQSRPPQANNAPQLIIKQGSNSNIPINRAQNPQNISVNNSAPPPINIRTNSLQAPNPLMQKQKLTMGSLKVNAQPNAQQINVPRPQPGGIHSWNTPTSQPNLAHSIMSAPGKLLNADKAIVNTGVNMGKGLEQGASGLVKTAIIAPAVETMAGFSHNPYVKQAAEQYGDQSRAQAAGFIQGAITRPAAGLAGTVKHPFNQFSYHPNSLVEQAVFGNRPVQNVAANVASNYDAHKNLNPAVRLGVAGADLAGQVLNILPTAAGATKLAKVTGAKAILAGRPAKLADSDVAALANYRRQAGTGQMMTDETYNRGIAAARKAGLKHTDFKGIDNLLGQYRTYYTKVAQRKDALNNIPIGLSTKDVSPKPNVPEVQPIKITPPPKIKISGGETASEATLPKTNLQSRPLAIRPQLAETEKPGMLEQSSLPPNKRIELITNASEPNIPLSDNKINIGVKPDVKNFLEKSTYKPTMVDTGDFNKDLETNANLTSGNYDANQLLVRDLIDRANAEYKRNPGDYEAAYHYTEDPSLKLTPHQQSLYDQYVKPINDMATSGINELKGSDFENAGHIPRIALDRGSKAENYLTGQSKNPSESVLRKSVGAAHTRTMHAIVDENGNRTVVSIKTPKDELGLAKGQKRVTAFRNGQHEDLGTFRTKSKEELMDKEIKPLQNKLNNLQKEGDALNKVRLTGGISSARIDALLKKATELQIAKDEGYGLTKAEQRTLREARLKFEELSRVKTTKTNAPSRLATINRKVLEVQRLINQVEGRYNPDELKDRVFIDKRKEIGGQPNPGFGKRYTIDNATTKEIEANTNVRYIKNPIVTTGLAHVNVRNAINAKQFLDWMKLRPDAEDHMIKVGTTSDIPENYETVNSPFFKGYMFDPKTAKVLNNLFGHENMTQNIAGKVWQGINNIATQTIVINPAIHGNNLAELADAQVSNTGLGAHPQFAANVARTLDPSTRGEMIQNYLRAGGHIPNYGKEADTILTRVADTVDIPHFSKANASVMSAIDATFRSAAFKTDVDRGMAPAEAIRQIDTFMGKKEMIGPVARNFGMFYHYFLRTLPRALGNQLIHPVKNFGSIVTTAAWFFGIQYGLNAAWQAFTGNKNAHLKFPGEAGLIHDISNIPSDIHQLGNHQIPSVVSSHVAPMVSILWDQLTGKQSYTGAPVNTLQQRAQNLEQHLISPSQNISKIQLGKSTPGEQLLNEFGLYTPHAAGAPAATKGPLTSINTAGAKPVITLNSKGQQDPTGYSQETDYYKALDKYITGAGLSTTDQNAANAYLQKSKTPDGKTILNSPKQTASNWSQLAANPGALKAVQNLEKASGNHDPYWDLAGNGSINGKPVSKIELWATYKSLAPGDLQRDAIAQQNPWLQKAQQDSINWASKQTFSGNVVQQPGYVAYPTISPSTQSMMSRVTELASIPAANRTQDQINELSKLENNPDLQNAYQAIDQYTNNVRASMDLPTIQYAPKTDPATQNFTNQYMAADKATRANLRTQYPQMYNQMEAAMEQQQLASVEKYGGEAYYGANIPQTFLGDISGLGQYDITKIANPNGTNSYALTDFTGNGKTGANGLPYISVAKAKPPASSSYKSSSSKKTPFFVKKRVTKVRPYYAKKAHKVFLNKGKPIRIASGGAGKHSAVKIKSGGKSIKIARAKAPTKTAGNTGVTFV